MFRFSKSSLARLETVDPRLQRIAQRALQLSSIDFGIPAFGGHRSASEQHELYRDGLSRCDGFDKRSRHQDGGALDFYAFVAGQASWDADHLTVVAAAILQAASEQGVKIRWGGHWKGFKDMPHVELI